MKVYISSTYRDLRDHRAAVDAALRRMGHDVLGMEQYVAEGTTPLQACLRDVEASDVYVVIVGWRYGFVPSSPDLNPDSLSITELEYRRALSSSKDVLAFVVDPDAPWPPSEIDALGPAGGANVLRFRSELGAAHLSGLFRTPDNLASQAAAAVASLGLNRQMAERALRETAGSLEDMRPFLSGEDLQSTLEGIKHMVRNAGSSGFLVIDLGAGNRWWSTRLYLLAVLLQHLTDVRQLVFSKEDGSFAGMASPAAVRQGLRDAFERLSDFDNRIRQGMSADVEREVTWVGEQWAQTVHPYERDLKVDVRWQLLNRWIGDPLIQRAVQISPKSGLTINDIAHIVESLLPDVPVDWPRPTTDLPSTGRQGRLMVVDRDEFALAIARQWVAASLPRIGPR